MPHLLYEIGTEELPAGYLRPALDQLRRTAAKELAEADLAHGEALVTGTPRRLALFIRDLAESQPDSDEEVMGPPAKAAFDADGNPTRAAEGFARKQGAEVSSILRKDTPRGEYCVVRRRRTGRAAAELLAEILPRLTRQIAFPKSMLWPGADKPFARPIRSLLALFGSEVIAFSVCGVHTGRTVEAHAILDNERLTVESADYEAYRELLRQHHVVVDMAEREKDIRQSINKALAQFGGTLCEEELLAEVANLVQYPSVAVGSFDREFLEVPAAVIEAAMMEHQRYFPVRNGSGALQPNFIVVSDRGPEPSDLIRIGNEQVLKARLADARFFYQVDRKKPLAERVDALQRVQFLKGLGAYRDKCNRLVQLVSHVAAALGLEAEATAHAERAALLCKADLITDMVGEFPKLQGEVGRIYAINDGEPEAVGRAILEHYLPKSADGALPQTSAGCALSLAEKLDNLISCFAMGLIPTGSADPYALRRQSQAVLRLIDNSGAHLKLSALLQAAQALLPQPQREATGAAPRLLEFIRDRLFQMSLDLGAQHDLINAALAAGWEDVVDFHMRLRALRQLSAAACWPALVSAVERTFNISKDAPEGATPEPGLYAEELEKELGALYQEHRAQIELLQADRKYEEASRRFAEVFAGPLHIFFDNVFVNVDDEAVRNNRIALLRAINRLYSERIADLSQIVTGVEK